MADVEVRARVTGNAAHPDPDQAAIRIRSFVDAVIEAASAQ